MTGRNGVFRSITRWREVSRDRGRSEPPEASSFGFLIIARGAQLAYARAPLMTDKYRPFLTAALVALATFAADERLRFFSLRRLKASPPVPIVYI